MGILTLLRNAFGRSRKGRATEAEGADLTPSQSPKPTVPSPSPEPQPAPSAQVPEPRSSTTESAASTESASTESTELTEDEHELVSAAFDKVTVPKPATPVDPVTAEPVTEKPAEPTVAEEPTPVTEVAPEPVAVTEPAAEEQEAAATVTEEPTPEPTPETEPVVAEPEPIAEAEVEPVAHAASEPVTQEPVAEAEVEPDPEPVVAEPEPVAAEAPEPAAEPDPAAESAPEPVVEAEPEPVAQVEPEAEPETVPEATPEPQPQPVPEAAPEPQPEPVAASADDTVSAPEPVAAAVDEPAAADGEDAPQGPLAVDDESGTGGAGGSSNPAEGGAPTPVPATLRTAYTAAEAALKATDLTGTAAKVYLVLDRSASMRPYYKDGSAQALAEQTLALAAHLDPEGPENTTVHVTFFSTEVDGTGELTLTDHENKIDDLHAGLGRMGRTSYHAAVEDVLTHHAKEAPGTRALVVFQTDGAPDAKTPANQALTDAAKNHPAVFFSFVAFGDPENKAFDYLRKLKLDNTSHFLAGATPRELTDTEVYEGILANWRP
ncbi:MULTISPECIES: VWA domain-containing protein [unclassified Streptomyces]|uniref:VWA domain-containing protein n=1 Tax=unclassified Streptomyces TaxID=2593676 RepID=UPI002252F020|nr:MULTISPECIES: VWA domain-containing protein [unclassified Streptomyces]MCX5049643.1 VWA domain-containing protein [Streptomyces sp. NBC_00474]MCX5286695.1 VWA domain-containing protein [Streptomyces sp. NBC_00183]